ncbi:MAG TPA: ABC transporter permease [Ktedonobacteraceae bacterium]|nr:ABC transporter permease [Ktedonobacteraceae bacterium]
MTVSKTREDSMTSSMPTRPGRMPRAFLPPALTLAGQRARKTWGLLLLTELGMLGAVLLACVVPLYTNVTLTAALRGTLTPQNSDIVVRTLPQLVSSSVLASTTRMLDHELKRTLGAYLSPSQFSIESQTLQMLAPDATGTLKSNHIGLTLISTEMAQAPAHLRQNAGQLPDPSASELQIAVTPATARYMGAQIGDVVHARLDMTDVYNKTYQQVLNLRLTGLFTPDTNDSFWHGDDFAPYADQNVHLYALMPNQVLLQLLDSLSKTAATHNRVFVSPPDILWYYHLDPARLDISDLDALLAGIQQIQIDNSNNASLQQDPYLEQTQTYLPSPDTLNNLNQRVSVIQFPVYSLVVMIVGLLLFFLSMMVNLLVERQNEAIATLRSRGASRWQILSALALQGIALAALALVLGLLLAPWLVRMLARQMPGINDHGALTILGGPLQSAQTTGVYALLAGVVALITIFSAAWFAARRDVVSLRRETARSTRRPLWQRLRLDLVAALIALAGYGASLYLLNSSTLDNRLYLLLLSPLALLQTLFLLLAALLILFRFYPQILRLGARLVEGRRGAAPVLALAQIARAPRQPVRMTMLLALASAFAIFSLIFTATQAQRVLDVASYQTGADFSGNLPAPIYTVRDLPQLLQRYTQVPGVQAASAGFLHQGQAGASLNLPVNFQAVDASTFAQAATWTAQDSSQSLSSLMHRLTTPDSADTQQHILPAIVDANTWNTLHLSPGATFNLRFPDLEYDHLFILRAVAEVQHIPTSGLTSQMGVLVAYPAFIASYTNQGSAANDASVALNYVWLHTRSDARSLASVRAALNKGSLALSPLYDRRASESALYGDPVYLTLIGELELGAITALFLALLGCLVASWLNTRSRLTSFVTLRALGATPRQVTATMAWEQGIIYTAALLLGILTGALLAALSLPSLVLTSVLPSQITGQVNNTSFYAAQFVPPLQVIIPPSLWLALGALVVICLLALGLMVHKIARSSVALILRLNED